MFQDPVDIVVARSVRDVVPAIQRVEAFTRQGMHAVGFVAYEAAPAFEPRFVVRPGYSGPLVWFGIFNGPTASAAPAAAPAGATIKWEAGVSESEHRSAVERIIRGIECGDFYQVNYTARFRTRAVPDPLAAYERLRQAQAGRYSALIQTGDSAVLSVSPELFFRRDGDRIDSRPMKGTAVRGRWAEEDAAFAERLRTSEKERAENVMIVDLIRNDLGRIAVPGTVEVPSLFDVERYPTVWQMTSHVTSQVPIATPLANVFAALFPCGSVTGAPKIAASRAIADLESNPRGVYCGAVGIVKPGGDCLFNVAIRTVTVEADGSATYGAGGGITADSVASEEFAELQAKAAVLDARADDFDLIETMRLENGTIPRLDQHLGRMRESAGYFGFTDARRGIANLEAELLLEARRRPTGQFRVRATLSRGRATSVELRAFQGSTNPRRVKLATGPVQSSDRLLFHKTTRRAVYDRALAEAGDVDDVVLFNERGELTETTIGNLVVELDGRLVTPALDCGLLPGMLRAEMLAGGELAEAVVPVHALHRRPRIWMINSLRGRVPLELTD